MDISWALCALNEIVERSCGRTACVFTILQPVHCIDCFILKKEDAVRFVVIYKNGYWGGPCGLKWGVPCG